MVKVISFIGWKKSRSQARRIKIRIIRKKKIRRGMFARINS